LPSHYWRCTAEQTRFLWQSFYDKRQQQVPAPGPSARGEAFHSAVAVSPEQEASSGYPYKRERNCSASAKGAPLRGRFSLCLRHRSADLPRVPPAERSHCPHPHRPSSSPPTASPPPQALFAGAALALGCGLALQGWQTRNCWVGFVNIILGVNC